MPRTVEEVDELEELVDPDEEPELPPVAKIKSAGQPAATAADIRAWAAGNGLTVSSRGRIHPQLAAAFEADDPSLYQAAPTPVKKNAVAPKAKPTVTRTAPTNGHSAEAPATLSFMGVSLAITNGIVEIEAPGKKVIFQG